MNSHVLALSAALLCLLPSAAQAEVPQILHYQGYLTNALGEAIDCPDAIACPNESFDITFRLYLSEAGGQALWEETHEGVGIVSGVFDAHLGSQSALEPSLFDGEMWLGVEVNATGELSPRQTLTSAAFAFRSADADNARSLGGLVPSAYATIESLPELCIAPDELPAVLAELGVLGGQADTLAAMTCLPDALVGWDGASWSCMHHVAPFSVTTDSISVGDTTIDAEGVSTSSLRVGESTTLSEGSLDLGSEADDELTAAMVKTLTGGGEADALHTHAGLGMGGVCYTAWNSTECGSGFEPVVEGSASFFGILAAKSNTGGAGAGISDVFCVAGELPSGSIPSPGTSFQSGLFLLQDGTPRTLSMPCAICCR
jgi:hypothetical protein